MINVVPYDNLFAAQTVRNESALLLATLVRSPAGHLRPSFETDPARWELMRPVLERMYVQEGRELSYIIARLHEEYGFTGTVQQYKKRFRKWGFRKYSTQDDIREVLSQDNGSATLSSGYVIAKSGRRINIRSARRHAKRRISSSHEVQQPRSQSDVQRSPPAEALEIMSQYITTMSSDQEFEIVLRSIRGYMEGNITSGLWRSDCPGSHLISGKVLTGHETWDLGNSIFDMGTAFVHQHVDAAFALASRICHNMKAFLLAETPSLVRDLTRLAAVLVHANIDLAHRVLSYVSQLTALVLHNDDHPLRRLTRYLMTTCNASASIVTTDRVYDLVYDEYCRLLGQSHYEALRMARQVRRYDTPDSIWKVEQLLTVLDTEQGQGNEVSFQCVATLYWAAMNINDFVQACFWAEQAESRADAASVVFRAQWRYWASRYRHSICYATEDYHKAELELVHHMLPRAAQILSEDSLFQEKFKVIDVLQKQGKYEQAAALTREMKRTSRRIREEVKV
ncbi:uncharacterized protein AB675_6025 [Cyphellophora attinorum]|uniref:Clr5 domain-containing protein n=1 Tax=Cyphellophora attinorum TaxID=1664694 RepID=A0A0N0NJG7_9EURO|nr:uncharacterized protein AB675_6025 [Phialophora attinorum]KPI36961.1 hypothetical protein AB675_6025 [Phialophora attinorum]